MLEQHIGLLTMTDSSTGRQIFCAPAGDTLSEVDSELALHGVTNVNWQPGVSLVTLVGTPESMTEIDGIAVKTMAANNLPVLYHDQQLRRSTFALPESESRKALETLYHAVSAYL